MIKLIIFDLDDTLYKELDFVQAGFKEVALYLSHKYQLSVMKLMEKMNETLLLRGRGKIFNELIEVYKLNESIGDLVNRYRQVQPELTLYQDAQELLEWAKSQEFYLGIITDGLYKVQHNKIKGLELQEKVDYIIATDELGAGYSKPHPKAFEMMLKKFNCLPYEAVYIGDNPNKDFIGARQLGVHTLRIIRQIGDHMQTKVDKAYEADATIYDLLEVKDWLQTIK